MFWFSRKAPQPPKDWAGPASFGDQWTDADIGAMSAAIRSNGQPDSDGFRTFARVALNTLRGGSAVELVARAMEASVNPQHDLRDHGDFVVADSLAIQGNVVGDLHSPNMRKLTMDDAAIAKEIRDTLSTLNAALRKAHDTGLTVEIDSISHQEIGRYGNCRVYTANIERRNKVA